MSAITTHVLDTSRGRPAAGVAVRLERPAADGSSELLGTARTDPDGRARDLLPSDSAPAPGRYRLVFETDAYFREQGVDGFYPEVAILFEIHVSSEHFHVPLLLSPFGYSTYRGS